MLLRMTPRWRFALPLLGLCMNASFACSEATNSDGLTPAEKAESHPVAAARQAATDSATGEPTRGGVLYVEHCADCHGSGGRVDGRRSERMRPKPVDHTDGATMNALSNDELLQIVRDGGASQGRSPLMPPFAETLPDEDLLALVRHIRSLALPIYEGPDP